MITQICNPQTKTNLNSRKLHWVVRPATQVYTYENLHGSLAEETCLALESSQGIADPIRDVAPEDFEAAYQWFYA